MGNWLNGAGPSTALTNFIRLLLLAVVLLLPACYHLRVLPEPIQPCSFDSGLPPRKALASVREILDKKLQLRILDEQQDGTVLITAPNTFFTDTGFGQPAGGRKYYVRLRIEVMPRASQSVITVSAYSFELRTSYAYSEDGYLRTLTKIYPYEEYPGMFNIKEMNREVMMVAGLIEQAMKE